ncbi:MAG: helix-turn-helix transcriptional regulator [Gemmatimonadaceae bacterium]|nr:helix-turn-helix transcriptional regulator [Gemmatimonadaceae bacterium]NUO95805.1 helix-turn-helix transcriptional regulator [Gemmatimonadaceae bacterium]NUP56516.1 helix-turn-helix transcriptional regulator [Gemmatimonadaceae bacterium]HWJ45063.1 helix-turn-helix transcriptional regulator [Gaiellaceae bacterium]
MSTEAIADVLLADGLAEGAPELTQLGKRLEILRIERGVSKQHLARHAGTSRQQLWRVMTGKSELTSSLRDRLAFALSVEPGTLSQLGPVPTPRVMDGAATFGAFASLASTPTLSEYLTDAQHLAATIRTLPAGDGGRRLKRALLNAVEDLAVEAGVALPIDYSEIRRRVLAGEL